MTKRTMKDLAWQADDAIEYLERAADVISEVFYQDDEASKQASEWYQKYTKVSDDLSPLIEVLCDFRDHFEDDDED